MQEKEPRTIKRVMDLIEESRASGNGRSHK